MPDYNRDSRGGSRGGRSFGGGRSSGGGRGGFGGGGRDRDERPQMFKATCAECGDQCEVPFKPSGDRPVLCKDCFRGNDGDRDRGPRRDSGERFGRDRDRGSRDSAEMFSATCSECGNECEVPFKPSGDKPVFCSECFGRNKSAGRNSEASKEQFEMLNAKLDKILKLITPVIAVSKEMQNEQAEVVAVAVDTETETKEAKPKAKAKKAPKKAAKAETDDMELE